MADTVAWEALPKQGAAAEQPQPCNSQHSASIASAVTTKSDQAASPLVAGNSVHSSPCLEPRARQDQSPPVDSGASRVVTALHNMLARGLDSDYVEGLRPVLQDGRLQISTYIKLSDSSEPVCIGLYPNLPAAVQAQKQSQQLVGSLPPGLARQLIEAQLQHSAQQQQQQQQGQQQQGRQPQAPAATVHRSPPANPSRWLSNISDATSGLPPSEPGRPTPLAAAGDNDHDDLTPHAAQQEAGAAQRQQLWLSHTQPPVDATGAPAPASPATAAGGASLAALTDDVINLLLRKGLHALAAVQHRDSDAGSEPAQQEEQQQAGPGVAPQAPGLRAPGSSLAAATAGAAARSGFVQQPPYAPPQLQNDYSSRPVAQHSGYGAYGEPDYGYAAAAAAAPQGGLPGPRHMQMGAPAGPGLQPMGGCAMGTLGAAAMTVPGPAAPAAADYMAALTAEYPVATSHQMYAAAQQQPAYPGLSPQQYSYAAAQYGAAAAQYAAASQMAAGPYGRAFNGGAGGDMLMYHQPQPQQPVPPKQPQQPRLDISKLQEPTWGMAAVPKRTYQPPPLPSYGGLGAAPPGAQDASELAAAAAAADQHQPRGLPDAGGSDWGDANDRKRGRGDPRLNCIKSVQYRVSRFPSELHELCVEHWERTRCARVVCNAVTGVMSVQGGRCVVSFNQGGQEVLKGVADYLRFAGEDRIKKWRRHVRMVDFPRPNNRTGELMTAEEFLCIVGYQSEQGGGKRGRYSADCSE